MTRLHRPALTAGLLVGLLFLVAAPLRADEETTPAKAPIDAPADVAPVSEYQQGMEATWSGDYEAARSHFETHLAKTPGDERGILALARVEFWTNRYPESVALYDQYLEIRPHDIDAKIELAHTLFWADDLTRAETVARDAVTVEPENIKANLIYAAVLQSTDRPEEADAVYDWILVLDPDNTNAKNRNALARPAAEPGNSFVLTSRNILSGDNFDFIGFKSVTGLAMGFFGFLTLEPQLRIRVIDDPRVKSPLTGIGPGVKLGISTGTPVSLWARMAYVPMMGGSKAIHGWSAGAGLDLRFKKPEISFWGAFNTELHGLERQSALATHEGLRRYDGSIGMYWAPAWFRLVASGALGGVYNQGADLGLNMSWWLSPAVRIHDGDWKIFIGYGFWGMVYQNPAPLLVSPADNQKHSAYWDPSAAMSHTIYLDLEAKLTETWRLMANLGTGLAQERSWATTTLAATWSYAALVNGRLAFGWKPSPWFEGQLGSGVGVSSRGGTPYTSWNVFLNLIGRW